MARLQDKVAIITGAATGIGEAVAHRFAMEGAKVVVNGLVDDPVDKVVEAIRGYGHQAVGFFGDISQAEKAKACVQKAIDEFGRLDVLVNNAGTFQTVAETPDFPDDGFAYMMRTNTQTVFMMTKYALPFLQKSHGNIISTGSEAGLLGQPTCTPYGASKGWIHAFMRGVALEQARYGVRANCVCPGPIDTEWHETDVSPMKEDMEADILRGTPLGRRGLPEEAANVYVFLASAEASFVTGALYFVDGGMSIGRGPIGERVPEPLRQPDTQMLNLQHRKQGLENKEVTSK